MNFLEPQPQAEETTAGNIYGKTVLDETPAGQYYLVEDAGGIVKKDPFNPAFIAPLFEQFHVEIDRMANKCQALQVKDDQGLDLATLMTNQAKQLEKVIEKKRVQEKEPYLKVTAVLDSETKGLKDRLVLIQKHINSQITPYLQKKEELKREAERKAQAERDRIQAELDEK
ncbi:MAG: hypothetical protein WC836_22370, partial [Desulfobacula sp.]